MTFKVSFKGLQHFTGSLGFATRYVEKTWGSITHAYEIGVRLEPVIRLSR